MPLRRLGSWLWQNRATVWAVVFTVLTFYALHENRDLSEQTRELALQNRQRAVEGQEAHDAICAFRADLERRIAAGRAFLEDNPGGIPGITATDIRRSIAAQESTLKSLKIRNCEGGN